MRTIIDLPERQVLALNEFCAEERISRAEALRRAVDRFLETRRAAGRQAAFGSWAPRGDSRAVVEALRQEWD